MLQEFFREQARKVRDTEFSGGLPKLFGEPFLGIEPPVPDDMSGPSTVSKLSANTVAILVILYNTDLFARSHSSSLRRGVSVSVR